LPNIPGDIFWFAGHTAWNADPGAIYKNNREDSMHANIGHIHKLLVIAMMTGVTRANGCNRLSRVWASIFPNEVLPKLREFERNSPGISVQRQTRRRRE